jgi:predicted nucleic acid-binding Zn finger protein
MKERMTAAERASVEAGGYVWFPGPRPGSVFCLSQSEAVYIVSEDSCTCPSFTIHHTDCKHILAWREHEAKRAA